MSFAVTLLIRSVHTFITWRKSFMTICKIFSHANLSKKFNNPRVCQVNKLGGFHGDRERIRTAGLPLRRRTYVLFCFSEL